MNSPMISFGFSFCFESSKFILELIDLVIVFIDNIGDFLEG